MTPEELWRIPELRKFRYWVICDVAVGVDGRIARGRGVRGFNEEPANFAAHHQAAFLQAIEGVIGSL